MLDFKVYVIKIGNKLFYKHYDLDDNVYITTVSFSEAWKTNNQNEAKIVADEVGGEVALFQVKELDN